MKRNGTGYKFIICRIILYPILLLRIIHEEDIRTLLKGSDKPPEENLPIKLKAAQDIEILLKDWSGNAQNKFSGKPMVDHLSRNTSKKG